MYKFLRNLWLRIYSRAFFREIWWLDAKRKVSLGKLSGDSFQQGFGSFGRMLGRGGCLPQLPTTDLALAVKPQLHLRRRRRRRGRRRGRL